MRKEQLLSYAQNNINSLFLLPEETPVLTTKQHTISSIPQVIIACILGIGAIFVSLSIGAYVHASGLLIMLTAGMLIMLTLGLIAKVLIDWHFHFYLVTNRRILEIVYKPFFSQDVNDVLLDQVRCTEIDIKIHGYIHGLIDVGDIIITFDRPTHQQEFVLHNIKSPRKNGTLLGHLLNTPTDSQQTKNVWYQEFGKASTYAFTKDLIPKQKISIV